MEKNNSQIESEINTDFPVDPNLIGEYLVEIRYILPIFLLLKNDIYDVHVDSRKGRIRTEGIKISSPLSDFFKVDDKSEIRIPSIRHDPFSRTRVTVWFKPTADDLRKLNDEENWERDPFSEGSYEPLLKLSLRFVNQLIAGYQHLTGESTLDRVLPWEIGIFEADMKIPSKKLTRPIHKKFIGGGGRPIHIIFGKSKMIDLKEKLKKLLSKNWDLPVFMKLLMTSRYHYLHGDYSAAVITAQSALEAYIGVKLKDKGIVKIKDTKVTSMGISHLCFGGLKALLGKNLKEIDRTLNRRISKAATLRNRVIHQGKDVGMNQANESIIAFKNAIEILSQMM